MTFRNSTRFPEGRFSGHERLPASLREFPRKAETTTISERLTITPSTSRHSRHTEKIPVKVLGLPGPTVPDRGQRANDPPRGKRIVKTNARMHKGQSGVEGH
ncbi:hypothetical protein CDL15_Pgr008281 [Punica granatum]|uniref:Uncharacterized protein n=1 Tax=Punica granatum TaxID=22663 RepID=A0A218XPC9_PUNGR|nr:hypothetical protein CDL15_Pgr008281 [Punica granatum]